MQKFNSRKARSLFVLALGLGLSGTAYAADENSDYYATYEKQSQYVHNTVDEYCAGFVSLTRNTVEKLFVRRAKEKLDVILSQATLKDMGDFPAWVELLSVQAGKNAEIAQVQSQEQALVSSKPENWVNSLVELSQKETSLKNELKEIQKNLDEKAGLQKLIAKAASNYSSSDTLAAGGGVNIQMDYSQSRRKSTQMVVLNFSQTWDTDLVPRQSTIGMTLKFDPLVPSKYEFSFGNDGGSLAGLISDTLPKACRDQAHRAKLIKSELNTFPANIRLADSPVVAVAKVIDAQANAAAALPAASKASDQSGSKSLPTETVAPPQIHEGESAKSAQ